MVAGVDTGCSHNGNRKRQRGGPTRIPRWAGALTGPFLVVYILSLGSAT